MKTSNVFKIVGLAIVLLVCFTISTNAQDAKKTFQKGLVKEEGEGALKEAIDIYSTVVENEDADRALRANALLHIGQCYEKLGQEKAGEAYRKLISEFADQEKFAAIGKMKLSRIETAKVKKSSDGIVLKEIWAPAEDAYGISPDGRYSNYIDWNSVELVIKDLQTGDRWNLTNRGTWKEPMQWPDMSIWSPDGKQLAYYWFNGEMTELHIINMDGTDDRIIYSSEGDHTPFPLHWSEDGKNILALLKDDEGKSKEEIVLQIVLVKPDDGSIKVVNTFPGLNSGCCGSISPDGKQVVYSVQQAKDAKANDLYISSTDGSKHELLVKDQANDRNPVWKPDGSGIIFLSDRSGTKDIWSMEIENGHAMGEAELEYSNIGDDTDLLRLNDNNKLIYRSSHQRRDIYTAQIDFNTGEILTAAEKISSTENKFNIKPFWSPNGKYVAYLVPEKYRDHYMGERYIINIRDIETKKERILKLDMYGQGGSHWNEPCWTPDDKKLLIHGRLKKEEIQGFFLVDIHTGKHEPIITKELEPMASNTNIGHLPELCEDGSELFFLTDDNRSIIKLNMKSREQTTLFTAEEKLLYLKLSHDGTKIAFGYFSEDRNALYMLSTKDGQVEKIAEFEKGLKPFVVSWTKDDKHLIFEKGAYGDNKDHSIWRLPLSGGEAEKLFTLGDIFPKGETRDFTIQPGGQYVAVNLETGQEIKLWSMENLLED